MEGGEFRPVVGCGVVLFVGGQLLAKLVTTPFAPVRRSNSLGLRIVKPCTRFLVRGGYIAKIFVYNAAKRSISLAARRQGTITRG